MQNLIFHLLKLLSINSLIGETKWKWFFKFIASSMEPIRKVYTMDLKVADTSC